MLEMIKLHRYLNVNDLVDPKKSKKDKIKKYLKDWQ